MRAKADDLKTEFGKTHPNVDVAFNFAGSPTLVQQINEGAPADVFASADQTAMDKAAAAMGNRGNRRRCAGSEPRAGCWLALPHSAQHAFAR